MELRYPWAFPKCLIPWMAPEPFAPRGSSERSLECQGSDVRGNLGEPEVLGGLPAEGSQGLGATPPSDSWNLGLF